MNPVFLVIAIFVLLFGFVVFFGAPYLPTLGKQKETALDLLDLKPGETMLELGCGDGRVLKAAAKRGWHAVGYELNPLLAIYARLYTWKYRDSVKIIWANYWRAQWPEAHGIYVFLLPKYMKKLDNKITQEYGRKVNHIIKNNGNYEFKLVSYAFKIPDKSVSEEKDGVYLYKY